MNRKGDCWDNAVTERFFGVLKNEVVHHIIVMMRSRNFLDFGFITIHQPSS